MLKSLTTFFYINAFCVLGINILKYMNMLLNYMFLPLSEAALFVCFREEKWGGEQVKTD